MTVTHRTLAGAWEICMPDGACNLPFHFPDTTPESMAAVPEHILWELCEVVDPPTSVTKEGRGWFESDSTGTRLHRAYDLPAWIVPGHLIWAHQGHYHRDGDAPAIIVAAGNGVRAWYRDNLLHRDDDKPALINASGATFKAPTGMPGAPDSMAEVLVLPGERQWWVQGRRIKSEGASPSA